MDELGTVCVIVDKVESILVIDGSKMGLCNSQAHSISKALTKRPRGDFNACLSFQIRALDKLERCSDVYRPYDSPQDGQEFWNQLGGKPSSRPLTACSPKDGEGRIEARI